MYNVTKAKIRLNFTVFCTFFKFFIYYINRVIKHQITNKDNMKKVLFYMTKLIFYGIILVPHAAARNFIGFFYNVIDCKNFTEHIFSVTKLQK